MSATFYPTNCDALVLGNETCELFTFAVTYDDGSPVDLTGYSAVMQVLDASGALMFELNTGDNTLINNGSAGTFTGSPDATIPNTAGTYSTVVWVTAPGATGTHPWWSGALTVLNDGRV